MIGSLLLAMSTTLLPQTPQPQHVAPLIPAQHFIPVTVPFDYFNRHIFITHHAEWHSRDGVSAGQRHQRQHCQHEHSGDSMGLQPVSIQQQKGLGLGSGKVYVAAAKDIDARIGDIQIANLMAVIDLKDLEHQLRASHRWDSGLPISTALRCATRLQ